MFSKRVLGTCGLSFKNPSRRVSCISCIHYLPFEKCCLTVGHITEVNYNTSCCAGSDSGIVRGVLDQWISKCGPHQERVERGLGKLDEIVGLAAGLLIIGGIILIAGDIAILVFLHVFYQLSTRCLWIGNSFGLARRPSPICGLPQKSADVSEPKIGP